MAGCMSLDGKLPIVIYTGHDELIGGDVHYTFDLVNKLINSGYKVKILTDHNKLFSKRADAWLKVQVPIEYLDTSPKLFTQHFFDRFYNIHPISFLKIKNDLSITETYNKMLTLTNKEKYHYSNLK